MKQKLIRLTQNKYVLGGALIGVTTFIANILNYLFYSFAAKSIGPVGYGEIVTLFSYVAIGCIPLTIATSIIVRRLGRAGKYKQEVSYHFEKWMIEKIKRWWFIFPIIFCSAFLLPGLTNLQLSTSITLVIMLALSGVLALYSGLLQGNQFFLLYCLSLILVSIIKLLGVTSALLHIGNLDTIYVSIIIGLIASIVPGAYMIRVLKKRMQTSSYSLNKRMLLLLTDKESIIACASLLGITLLGNADIIIVKKLFTPEMTGMYGAWSLFAKTVLYFLFPINTILFIFFSSRESRQHHKIVMIALFGILSVAGVLFYTLYSTFGHILVSVVLSKSFSSIEHLLPLAALFGISYTVITIVNSYFVAQKSNVSLVGILTIPLYIGALLLFGKTIEAFITVNVVYSLLLASLYSALFVLKSETSRTKSPRLH